MSEKNTAVRSMHDVGLAAWFGGSLMGAVGVNGAAAAASDPSERIRLAGAGWQKWQPVSATAIAAHLLGGAGLVATNKGRVATQPGARANTLLKTALTGAALGLEAWNRKLGMQIDQHADEGAEGATEPGRSSSEEMKAAQRKLKVSQWALPAVTGVLLVMGAQQGEQQRPQSLVRAQLGRLTS
jgi:hypothetical protein